MGSRKQLRYLTSLAGLATLGSLAAIPLSSAPAAASAATHQAAAPAASRMIPADRMHGRPYYQKTSKPTATGTFSCQAPESATNPAPCYGPAQIRAAYNVPSNLTGKGETIAIVDAYGDPTVQSDLSLFDSTFGLSDPTLNVIYPDGKPVFDPTSADEVDWAGEISLDVQWAHVIAPGAKIDLVISKSDQDADILSAQQYVVKHNLGDVLSQSFGEAESCQAASITSAQHKAFQIAQAERMTVFASAGDDGAAQLTCDGSGYLLSASTPASDPLVTGVGGTHLNADFTTGAYQSESVWNDSGQAIDIGAGGGGFSTVYAKPSYQRSAHTGHATRGVPDVAYSGDIYGAVLVACSECNAGAPAFFEFAGTSAGSPQWAAIATLADQSARHRLGFLNPTLYRLGNSLLYTSAFHDVTTGNNTWDVTGVTGYQAHRGWDPTTGLGTPKVATLVNLLAHLAP